MKRKHTMPFGADVLPDGSVRFRLWAPAAKTASLCLEDETKRQISLTQLEQGWFELITREATPGARYRFLINGETKVPDPASRFQPADVHGPSEVLDPAAFEWKDDRWRGRPWEEAVIYELHIGAFTPEGTFRGVEEKLDYLRALGITAVELMLKAVREAKEHTSWANTNAEYEDALVEFVRAILERNSKNRFLADIEDFQRSISRYAVFNSLSQTLLKMTAPGVPDIYQGNELFEFALVDPDNRHPVDYERRRLMFKKLTASCVDLRSCAKDLLADPDIAALKMYLTWKALSLRRSEAALFQRGSYVPLRATGEKSEHLVAFARQHEGRTAITAVPRLSAKLLGEDKNSINDGGVWRDTQIEVPASAASCYHNAFTGECIAVTTNRSYQLPASTLFRNFPVALLMSEASSGKQEKCANP